MSFKHPTIEESLSDMHKYEDTLVLIDGYGFFPIVLFKCVISDPDDYYYKVIDINGEEKQISCVGRMIPLVDKLDKEDYNALVYRWNFSFENRYKDTIAK